MDFFITPGVIGLAIMLACVVTWVVIDARCTGKRFTAGGRVLGWGTNKVFLLRGCGILAVIATIGLAYEFWQVLATVEEETQKTLKKTLMDVIVSSVLAVAMFRMARAKRKELSEKQKQ